MLSFVKFSDSIIHMEHIQAREQKEIALYTDIGMGIDQKKGKVSKRVI